MPSLSHRRARFIQSNIRSHRPPAESKRWHHDIEYWCYQWERLEHAVWRLFDTAECNPVGHDGRRYHCRTCTARSESRIHRDTQLQEALIQVRPSTPPSPSDDFFPGRKTVDGEVCALEGAGGVSIPWEVSRGSYQFMPIGIHTDEEIRIGGQMRELLCRKAFYYPFVSWRSFVAYGTSTACATHCDVRLLLMPCCRVWLAIYITSRATRSLSPSPERLHIIALRWLTRRST